MFEDLKRVFSQSVSAFLQELGRRDPEDDIAELLGAMRREMVAARAALAGYGEELERIGAELAREGELVAQCERRAVAARRIGDGETVRIAEEFAVRHRARLAVLQQKSAAARAELELRTREVEEMKQRYAEADANRFQLLAQMRRARAGERMRSALDGQEGPFAEFARMEEKVDDAASYADAVRDLGAESGSAPPPRAPADDVDARLRELKRRMRQE